MSAAPLARLVASWRPREPLQKLRRLWQVRGVRPGHGHVLLQLGDGLGTLVLADGQGSQEEVGLGLSGVRG